MASHMIQINLDYGTINRLDGLLLFLIWGLSAFDLIRHFPNPNWETLAALLFLIMLRALFFARLPDAWGLTDFSDLVDGPVIRFVTYFAGLELIGYGLWVRHCKRQRKKLLEM